MTMRDDTPYYTRPATEVERERQCMSAVLDLAKPVGLIYEAFGGVGLFATLCDKKFPRARVRSWDLDPQCVLTYNGRGLPRAICRQGDALEGLQTLGKLVPGKWAASLDFNRLTIMDLRGRKEGAWKVDLLSEVFKRSPLWVQVTDSAVRYLHLNWERYGLDHLALGVYVATLDREFRRHWGYAVTAQSAHHAATYLLLEKV